MNKEKYLEELDELELYLSSRLEEACDSIREIIDGIEELESLSNYIEDFPSKYKRED